MCEQIKTWQTDFAPKLVNMSEPHAAVPRHLRNPAPPHRTPGSVRPSPLRLSGPLPLLQASGPLFPSSLVDPTMVGLGFLVGYIFSGSQDTSMDELPNLGRW